MGLQRGYITVAEDMLLDSNINRSPSSYLLNPEKERSQYAKEGDTDKRMLQLQFTTHDDRKDIGILNWFAVHGTSMNSSNQVCPFNNSGYGVLDSSSNVGNHNIPVAHFRRQQRICIISHGTAAQWKRHFAWGGRLCGSLCKFKSWGRFTKYRWCSLCGYR